MVIPALKHAESKTLNYNILPTIGRFHESSAQIRAIVGSVGSGKTTGATWEVCRFLPEFLYETWGITHTKWAIIRNCYDANTEILTEKRGWIKFNDLASLDAVATLKGGYLTYEIPSNYYKASYSGTMIGIRGQNMDLLVTPNHHLWVSPRKTRKKIWYPYKHIHADDIYGRDGLYRLQNTAKWQGKKDNHTTDFFEFLGFWFAEGSVSIIKRKDCAGYHHRLVLTQKKEVDYVHNLLKRNNIDYGIHQRPDGTCYFNISQKSKRIKKLTKELFEYGKAKTKSIPGYIKYANAGKIRAFLKGYQKGDGSYKTNTKTCDHLYTSSHRLSDDLQELIIKIGKSATINRTKRGEFVITIHAPSHNRPIIKKKQWRKESYNGYIYCVEVSTHVVLVRRNGKTAWCGQTYPELIDTTQQTLFKWFPMGDYKVQRKIYYLRWKMPDGKMILVELLFRSCDNPKDVREFKSLEITGYWVDESIEVDDAAKRMLKTRIGRWPGEIPHPVTGKIIPCPVRFGIETTNPPDVEHPTYSQFKWIIPPPEGSPIPQRLPLKNHEGFWQPPRENVKHLRKGYYEDLREEFRDQPDWIDMYLDGKPGIIVMGRLVYDNYRGDHHVAKDHIPWVKDYGKLIRGWDNSGNCPACIILQRKKPLQFQALREYVTDKEGIVDFTKRVVADCGVFFPNAEFLDWADPAGGNKYPRREGGFTSNAELMATECGVEVEASDQNWMARKESVDQALARIDGLLIDPSCTRLISGFMGGYHYPQIGSTGRHSEKPQKNRFAHIHEALQYVLVKLMKESSDSSTPSYRPPRIEGAPGLSWMSR